MSDWFSGFSSDFHDLGDTRLHVRTGGRARAAPLLLLHGFPQTGALWHRVARRLAARFFLVMPDLRGYGASSKPEGWPDHANYSKRALAGDMHALMQRLGHERYGLVGHDRGGRVAHRLALDHAEAVSRLCVIDIVPTLDMYEATDLRFARAYYHWFFLIQPRPLPERLIGADPVFYLHHTLGGWGSRGTGFIEPEALVEYERSFCTPEGIHGACEDYRASADIDLTHDRESRAAGRKVGCDMLVLWGERGVVARLYQPLELWQAQCTGAVSGRALAAGHFVPEELPETTADELASFFEAA